MHSLDIGAGPHSDADVQIDQVKWEKTTHVRDILDLPYPFEDDEFDEVRLEQVLEHIPTVVHYKENGKFTHIYPRVALFAEVHRILKPGGMFHVSVPGQQAAFSQDPTHVGPMPQEGFLNYFCGQWGGNEPGSFTNDAYGITFKFDKVSEFWTNEILTIRLRKP